MKSNYQQAFAAFANTVYDLPSVTRLLDELRLVERSLFKEKPGTISAKAKDYITGRIISIFEEIELAGLEPADDRGQLELLRDVIAYLSNLPQVKVTLAFDPTASFINRLNGQISDQTRTKVILDVVVDDHIIAGAIFEYGGKISESTLQNKLELTLSTLIARTG